MKLRVSLKSGSASHWDQSGPVPELGLGEGGNIEKELNSKRFNASKNIFGKGDFSEHFRTSEQQNFIYLFIYLFVYRCIHSLFISFFSGEGSLWSFI